MRAAAQITFIVMLVLGMAGCYSIVKMPDIATASVYGPDVSGGPLSPSDVAQLSRWLKAHDAGWKGLMEAVPKPITMSIVMHDPSGQQVTLQVFESPDGSAMVHFLTSNTAQLLERYLPAADVASLRAAVGKAPR